MSNRNIAQRIHNLGNRLSVRIHDPADLRLREVAGTHGQKTCGVPQPLWTQRQIKELLIAARNRTTFV